MCLPSRCLAMDVCSGSTVPTFRRLVTILHGVAFQNITILTLAALRTRPSYTTLFCVLVLREFCQCLPLVRDIDFRIYCYISPSRSFLAANAFWKWIFNRKNSHFRNNLNCVINDSRYSSIHMVSRNEIIPFDRQKCDIWFSIKWLRERIDRQVSVWFSNSFTDVAESLLQNLRSQSIAQVTILVLPRVCM
jgi:hypothetical protein